MMRDYLVEYPSGNRLRPRGTLAVVDFGEDGVCPTIDDGERVFVLDPRAIVRDQVSGNVVYHPSRIDPDALAPWVREWLAEHLAWGATR